MNSLKIRYYNHRRLSAEEIQALNSFLEEHANACLWPEEIRAYKTSPGFKDAFGFRSWSDFACGLDTHAGVIRKYGIDVYAKGDRSRRHRLGWITVRNQEFAIAAWNSHHYPSIGLVNTDVQNGLSNRVFELIAERLGLQLTSEQKYTDFIERLRESIQRDDVLAIVSTSFHRDNLDLAVMGVTRLVESALRKKCLEAGRTDAKGLSGVDLARVAYHEEQGCLTPPIPIAARARHGAFVLVQGFFHYIRNGFAHNAGAITDNYQFALPVIQLCEFLLSMIEESVNREQ